MQSLRVQHVAQTQGVCGSGSPLRKACSWMPENSLRIVKQWEGNQTQRAKPCQLERTFEQALGYQNIDISFHLEVWGWGRAWSGVAAPMSMWDRKTCQTKGSPRTGTSLLSSSVGKSHLEVKLATNPLPVCLSLLAAWAAGATGTRGTEISVCDSLVSRQPLVRNRGILILLCIWPRSSSVERLSRQVAESKESLPTKRSGLLLTVLWLRDVRPVSVGGNHGGISSVSFFKLKFSNTQKCNTVRISMLD